MRHQHREKLHMGCGEPLSGNLRLLGKLLRRPPEKGPAGGRPRFTTGARAAR